MYQRQVKKSSLEEGKLQRTFGWFARINDDGTGLISCPWERWWSGEFGSDQNELWRWKSRFGEGWAAIAIGYGETKALQMLRDARKPS